jgi:4-hydroxyacetophenone monooxygenase
MLRSHHDPDFNPADPMSIHLQPAEKNITEDDAFIARVLEHASIPTLMMSIVHVRGENRLLSSNIRPKKPFINQYDGGLTEQEKAHVRAMALEALRNYRDRGCTLPPPPSPELVREMMSFIAGERVPDEYVPMMLEELALDGRDSRAPRWNKPVPQSERVKFHVLIIGAGMSGLLQGMRLQEAGIAFTIVEKNDSVGGTWYENRYPGCRVDIANHFYSYSFEPNQRWSEYFARRDELLEYFTNFAKRHGLERHVRFNTEVIGATFDEQAACWCVKLGAPGGGIDTIHANAVISAVGQLNRPMIPNIRGRELFTGAQMHSARWDSAISLAGKRVAVVGSGASAFQLVPAIAQIVERLYVFQRSAPWMLPNSIYHEPVSDEFNWLIQHVPYYGRWFRFLIFWPGSDGSLPGIRIDPKWPHQDRSVNAINDQMRAGLIAYMKQQIGDDPVLLEKVTPKFPVMGKRMLQDNGSWLKALRRSNVELVTEAVNEIDGTGILGSDRHYEVDVIVYATGFHATKFLWPMEITGRGGKTLSDVWGDEPRAYLGITVPDFPNLFCLYGPATNLAHAGSIIFHAECQVRYTTECIKALLENRSRAMDCRPEAYDDYNRRLVAELDTLVWSHPAAGSWYRNRAGRVVTTSPWRLVDYWNWTRAPNLADYQLIA